MDGLNAVPFKNLGLDVQAKQATEKVCVSPEGTG
jgi:hypothetical protein